MRLLPLFLPGGANREDDKFMYFYWDQEIQEKLFALQNESSFNPGQQTIIADSSGDIYNYLIEIGPNYNPDDFITYLGDTLGPEKFAALSETWENLSEDLVDSWDHSTGGDGFAKKKFLGVIYE
jgi:hypothetical protein